MNSLTVLLEEAEMLMLTATPCADGGRALVDSLAALVGGWEVRSRPRGVKLQAELQRAVAAVVGGVLMASLRRGKLVWRSRKARTFGRGVVGRSAALLALDGLTALGYLRHHSGIRYETQVPFEDATRWAGKASRYEAPEALLALAAFHGLTPETVKANFATIYPTKPEPVTDPIRLKPFDEEAILTPRRSDETFGQLKRDARTANKVLARHSWQHAQPPQLFRTFRQDWKHGGRWIVAGAAPIQLMAKEDRLAVLIDGLPVSEVDARGSTISIVAALAGVPEILGDPYQMGNLSNYDRDVVKLAVNASMGTGRLRKVWPRGMEHYEDDVPMAELAEDLAAAHPYLTSLPDILGVPAARVSLRLQNIEAECLTHALRLLWLADVPAVPMHDGLLVPSAAAALADELLRAGYQAGAGAIIRATIRQADSGQ